MSSRGLCYRLWIILLLTNGVTNTASATALNDFSSDVENKERSIGVFVSLCDNVHQGIVPVPKAIGNGDDPDHNLYWGNAEGLDCVFGKSTHWKKEATAQTTLADVLQIRTYRHTSGRAVLTAFAYRGSATKTCLEDFENALQVGQYDLVIYLGHNGLMDFSLPLPGAGPAQNQTPECIVLCCKSQSYFQSRIDALKAAPILLTKQFMYPGAFIIHDVLENWIENKGLKAYRDAAGRAYATNQKISLKAALGVFADLDKQAAAP